MDYGVVVCECLGIVILGPLRRASRSRDLPQHPASETLTDGCHDQPIIDTTLQSVRLEPSRILHRRDIVMELQDPINIAYLTPGLDMCSAPNGIIPYACGMAAALRRAGHGATLLTMGQEAGDAECYRVVTDGAGLLSRLTGKLRPRGHHDRTVVRAIVATTLRAVRERGVQLLEMEETFGWAEGVQGRLPIPVVVRLHGPALLDVESRGVSDASGVGPLLVRIAAEGKGIESAAGITSPTRDTLDRTRSYYGIKLDGAAVFPPPVRARPVWTPAGCDPDLVQFVGRFDRHKGGDLLIDAFQRVCSTRPQTASGSLAPIAASRTGSVGCGRSENTWKTASPGPGRRGGFPGRDLRGPRPWIAADRRRP